MKYQHYIIKDKYEDKIMNLFPKSLIKFKKEAPYERQRFVSFTKELVVKTVKTVAQLVINHEIEKFCGAIISFLQKQVEKQIDQLKIMVINMPASS